MEQDYKNFVVTLYKLVFDLNRYHNSLGATELLKVFDKLNMAKIIVKVNTVLSKFITQISNKDEKIFDNSLILLPNIDLSIYWSKLNTGQKEKVWTYLKIIYLESDLLINYKTKKEGEMSQLPNQNDIKSFDPFVGVGENNKAYSVDEIMSATSLEEHQDLSSPGFESLLSLIGIDKLFDMNSLSEQLKNIKKEDIDGITDSLKNYLGLNPNDKTSQLVSDIITNISDELSNIDTNNNTPLLSIYKIAESVASKIKPKVSTQNINLEDIINTSQNLMGQCKDEKGNPLFNDNINPFSMLSQLSSNKNMSQKEYTEQCNNMLKHMGVNNIDINQLMQTQNQKKRTKYVNKRR